MRMSREKEGHSHEKEKEVEQCLKIKWVGYHLKAAMYMKEAIHLNGEECQSLTILHYGYHK